MRVWPITGLIASALARPSCYPKRGE